MIQGNVAGGRNNAAGKKELKMGWLEVSCTFEPVEYLGVVLNTCRKTAAL